MMRGIQGGKSRTAGKWHHFISPPPPSLVLFGLVLFFSLFFPSLFRHRCTAPSPPRPLAPSPRSTASPTWTLCQVRSPTPTPPKQCRPYQWPRRASKPGEAVEERGERREDRPAHLVEPFPPPAKTLPVPFSRRRPCEQGTGCAGQESSTPIRCQRGEHVHARRGRRCSRLLERRRQDRQSAKPDSTCAESRTYLESLGSVRVVVSRGGPPVASLTAEFRGEQSVSQQLEQCRPR